MRFKPIVIKWPLEGRGLTLYPFIFAHKDWPSTFKHECMHWYQIQRMGVLSFYWAIIKEYLKHGMNYGPLEQECERYEAYPLGEKEKEWWDG